MDAFSHTLALMVKAVLKAGITKLSNKLTVAGYLLFSIVSSVNPGPSKKESYQTTEKPYSLLCHILSLSQVKK